MTSRMTSDKFYVRRVVRLGTVIGWAVFSPDGFPDPDGLFLSHIEATTHRDQLNNEAAGTTSIKLHLTPEPGL